jgi:hypothetical protein
VTFGVYRIESENEKSFLGMAVLVPVSFHCRFCHTLPCPQRCQTGNGQFPFLDRVDSCCPRQYVHDRQSMERFRIVRLRSMGIQALEQK